MKQHNLSLLSDAQFRRVTGVKRTTFQTMIQVLEATERKKMASGGRPHKLSLAQRLLMTLEYLREYRTYLHIATSYGLSESNAYSCIGWIEDTLVKSKEFRLPGKKALYASDREFEVILVDATESPIERPKKNSVTTIQAKKRDIPSRHRSS